MINNAAEATIRPVTVSVAFIPGNEWSQSVEITTCWDVMDLVLHTVTLKVMQQYKERTLN